jgi:hypothetical protein
MPYVAGTPVFTNGTFAQSELLKIIQENGTKVLWKEIDALDAVVKKSDWPWGKQVTYHLTVDAGGGAFAGINLNSGYFAPGDKVSSLTGVVVPKFQTFTMQFERFMDQMTKSQAQAYINSMRLEFEQKTMFQKSFMATQLMGDGTGRIATPVGIGPNDDAVGVSRLAIGAAAVSAILLSNGVTAAAGNAANNLPIKIKMSSLDTAVGDVAHLLEGSMVSFYFADYDSNNDGTVDANEATCVPRLLILGFGDGQAADTTILVGSINYYDAFRVVKIEQENDAIYVVPGRKASLSATSPGDYVSNTDFQSVQWCPGVTFTGGLYCFPVAGLTATFAAASNANYGTATANGFTNIFAPSGLTTATYLVHPLYVPETYALARQMLGLTWTIGTTDITQINPYIATGIETLLMEQLYVVHGINRGKVLQYLPTITNLGGQSLKFNSFFSFLAQHANRNRTLETGWNVLPMNPVVYASMISQSEQQRIITDGKGIRGEDGAKLIRFGGKTYQLEMHTAMRKNRIYLLPKDSIEMHGGTIEKVEVDGQSSFLTILNGRRVNVVESYNTVKMENLMRSPREAGAIRNFDIISL